MRTASSLLEELRAVDESTAIEAKTASKIDRSVVETVCAFANEPGLGGGHLLLGVAESTQLGLFARTYIRDDLPASFRLPEGEIVRTDETILPIRVLREALVNAVMHRSYRIHGAIQILRYANRIEIRNPGHSLKAEEQLGEPGSEARNPHIAAVLHDVHLAETKGSGIRVMRELMQGSNLLPPTFESSRRPDQFVATFLFHHFLEEADLEWLGALTPEKLSDDEARALVFVRELGAINNAVYREINRTDTLQSSAHLRRLRDLGILEMRGSGNRTYYVGTEIFASAGPRDRSLPADLPQSAGSDLAKSFADVPMQAQRPSTDLPMPAADLPMPAGESSAKATDLPMPAAEFTSTLPSELRARLANLGPRPRVEVIQDLIVALCSFRPWSATELGQLLGERDPRNLAKLHLRPLKEAGKLAYLIPEMPKHPQQKYVVPNKEQS